MTSNSTFSIHMTDEGLDSLKAALNLALECDRTGFEKANRLNSEQETLISAMLASLKNDDDYTQEDSRWPAY